MAALRPRIWLIVLAAIVATVGGYLGLFTVAFALVYQDIDGPTSPLRRAVGCVVGLAVLVPSVVLGAWAARSWRRRLDPA